MKKTVVSKIDKNMLKKMFEFGTLMIAHNYETINELNVFPVPDGDTGTNMKITTTNALQEIQSVENFNSIFELSKSFSRALLMNARGNSGVILSQIIKGFVSPFKEGQLYLNAKDIKLAFTNAKKTAYSSVANPVEGTILTVIRVVSEKIMECEDVDLCKLFSAVLKIAQDALKTTTDLLPKLKEVGVVDSGGFGLVKFIEGMKLAICNERLPFGAARKAAPKKKDATAKNKNISKTLLDHYDVEEGFGYCSEIILKLGVKIEPNDDAKKPFDINKFRKDLEKIGDSLVLVSDEDIVKTHIHTKNPQKLLELGQKYGEFIKIKIENMTEQFYERLSKEGVEIFDDNKFIKESASRKLSNKIELVHTVPTKEMIKVLKEEYNFNHLLLTSEANPSIKDLIESITRTKSSKVILVLDDTNAILAAKQAASTLKDKIDVRIIPCSNIVESLIVSLEFDQKATLDANEKIMNKALKETTSGLVSNSIKDVKLSNISVKKGDFIGITEKKIIAANTDEFKAISFLMDKLIEKSDKPDIAIIFKGKNANEEILSKLEEYLLEKYEIVCDFKEGNQTIYQYIIGVQ